MQNLIRRPSGVYVTRLVVPERLRSAVGKRELIASTGARDLSLAKIVASAQLAQWRRQFFDLDRLTAATNKVNHDSIVKIAAGHPALTQEGYLPLSLAAAASGIDEQLLLRNASDGRLFLYMRLSGVEGALLPFEDLPVDDAELGTRLVPQPDQMPNARRELASGAFALDKADTPAVVGALLAGLEVADIVLLRAHRPGLAFIPDKVLRLGLGEIELNGLEVDALRRSMAVRITPKELEAARTAQAAGPASHKAGKHARKRLSDAIEVYTTTYLPQTIKSDKAIQQQRKELELLVEFEGDLELAKIDSELLRSFRDTKLSKLLAKENHARLKYGTKSMTESIKAAEGQGWPVMSIDERDVRIQRIARMFRWLHDQKWIADNPATSLRGESVAPKAARSRADLAKAVRKPFDHDELQRIFGVRWYQTGRGEMTKAGTYREFQPFQFWLPLLGLFAGCRIGEASQFWLDDVKCSAAGTWYLDINKATVDKDLKTDWSARQVPLHPILLQAGFVEWCDALRGAGFKRVFPELSWFETLEYSKEPVRKHSELFERLGMPRDNTKVFHSLRHNLNNSLERMDHVKDVARKRIMGHLPGEGVNERHYLEDRSPDETIEFVKRIDFHLPRIARFDAAAGLKAVKDALRRKTGTRRGREDLGPVQPSER